MLPNRCRQQQTTSTLISFTTFPRVGISSRGYDLWSNRRQQLVGPQQYHAASGPARTPPPDLLTWWLRTFSSSALYFMVFSSHPRCATAPGARPSFTSASSALSGFDFDLFSRRLRVSAMKSTVDPPSNLRLQSPDHLKKKGFSFRTPVPGYRPLTDHARDRLAELPTNWL